MKPIKQAKIQKLVVFVKKSWFGRNEIRLEKVLKSVSKCRISYWNAPSWEMFVCVTDLLWFTVIMGLKTCLRVEGVFFHMAWKQVEMGSKPFQIFSWNPTVICWMTQRDPSEKLYMKLDGQKTVEMLVYKTHGLRIVNRAAEIEIDCLSEAVFLGTENGWSFYSSKCTWPFETLKSCCQQYIPIVPKIMLIFNGPRSTGWVGISSK